MTIETELPNDSAFDGGGDKDGNIEITKVKVTIDDSPAAAAAAATTTDLEQGEGQQQQTLEQQPLQGVVSSTYTSTLFKRPQLLHMESNRNLIKNLSLEDGIVSKDAALEDIKFYIHWLITFGPIGIGVTLYWRGMWTILDLYLFPDDPIKSAWTSLLLGLCTGILCHSISVYYSCQMNKYDDDSSSASLYDDVSILSFGSNRSLVVGSATRDGKHSSTKKQQQLSLLAYGIIERIFSFIVAFGAVTYWRGVWILWDELVLVDNPKLQNWTSLIVGTTLLFALRSFRSVFAPPMVYMPDDADDLDGLTLEVCDDLWWEPASIVHQRRALTQRQTLRVANLLEWKRVQKQEQKLSTRVGEEAQAAAQAAATVPTGGDGDGKALTTKKTSLESA